MRSPVKFALADTESGDQLIVEHAGLAAVVCPDAPDDASGLARIIALTQGANRIIADGRTKQGAKFNDLAHAADYAGDNHIRAGVGPWMREWGDVAVRTLSARYTPVIAEHVYALPSRVRRESNWIACEHHPGCAYVKPLVNLSVSAIDRHLDCWQMPFATGTSYDGTSPNAEFQRINECEQALGEPLPGSAAEYLTKILADRANAKEHLQHASSSHRDLLLEAGLNPDQLLGRAFSDLLVIEALHFGAPTVPGEMSAGIILPGHEQQLLEVVGSDMAGIAYCGTLDEPRQLHAARQLDDLGPELVTGWGLSLIPWQVNFRVDGDLLSHTGPAPNGRVTQVWRVFGMNVDDNRAAGLAQRVAEGWQQECIKRAQEACAPGKVYPKKPNFRMAMRAMLRVADAARVTAERTRRAREITGG